MYYIFTLTTVPLCPPDLSSSLALSARSPDDPVGVGVVQSNGFGYGESYVNIWEGGVIPYHFQDYFREYN